MSHVTITSHEFVDGFVRLTTDDGRQIALSDSHPMYARLEASCRAFPDGFTITDKEVTDEFNEGSRGLRARVRSRVDAWRSDLAMALQPKRRD